MLQTTPSPSTTFTFLALGIVLIRFSIHVSRRFVSKSTFWCDCGVMRRVLGEPEALARRLLNPRTAAQCQDSSGVRARNTPWPVFSGDGSDGQGYSSSKGEAAGSSPAPGTPGSREVNDAVPSFGTTKTRINRSPESPVSSSSHLHFQRQDVPITGTMKRCVVWRRSSASLSPSSLAQNQKRQKKRPMNRQISRHKQ